MENHEQNHGAYNHRRVMWAEVLENLKILAARPKICEYIGRIKQKMSSNMRRMIKFKLSCTCAGRLLSIHNSVETNDSDSG